MFRKEGKAGLVREKSMNQVAYIPNPDYVTIRKLINVSSNSFILYLYNRNQKLSASQDFY